MRKIFRVSFFSKGISKQQFVDFVDREAAFHFKRTLMSHTSEAFSDVNIVYIVFSLDEFDLYPLESNDDLPF